MPSISATVRPRQLRPADAELAPALLLQNAPELGAEHAPGARAPDARRRRRYASSSSGRDNGCCRRFSLRPARAPRGSSCRGRSAGPSSCSSSRARSSLMWQARRWPVKKRMIVAVELFAAELQRHVEPRRGLDEPGIGLRLERCRSPAPTHQRTEPQVPPSCASPKVRAAIRRCRPTRGRTRGGTGIAGTLRWSRSAVTAGSVAATGRCGPLGRAPDHRAPGRAARIVGVGESWPGAAFSMPVRA